MNDAQIKIVDKDFRNWFNWQLGKTLVYKMTKDWKSYKEGPYFVDAGYTSEGFKKLYLSDYSESEKYEMTISWVCFDNKIEREDVLSYFNMKWHHLFKGLSKEAQFRVHIEDTAGFIVKMPDEKLDASSGIDIIVEERFTGIQHDFQIKPMSQIKHAKAHKERARQITKNLHLLYYEDIIVSGQKIRKWRFGEKDGAPTFSYKGFHIFDEKLDEFEECLLSAIGRKKEDVYRAGFGTML